MSSGKSEGTHSGPYGAAVMTSLSWFSGNRDPSRKFMPFPLVVRVMVIRLRVRVQLLEEDRRAEAHAVQALQARELQHGGDLFLRGARLERALDVPAHAGRVHVRARCVERDADELDRLRVERAGDGRGDRHRDHLLGPRRIELGERFPVGIPVAARTLADRYRAQSLGQLAVLHGAFPVASCGDACGGAATFGVRARDAALFRSAS